MELLEHGAPAATFRVAVGSCDALVHTTQFLVPQRYR